MSKHIPYIAIIALLVVIHFLDEKVDRLEKENIEHKYNDLQLKLDSTETRLQRSQLVRDSLNNAIATLHLHSKSIESQLAKANKKLEAIPGRYQFIPADSLSKLMEERAQRWKKEN